jgi:hypothetical protein
MLAAFEGFVPASEIPGTSESDPLLSFDVAHPESLSRWMIFVKWLLAIPHFVVLYLFGIAAGFIVIIAWFAILITGRFPRGLWDFMVLYMRWNANVIAYAGLLRDDYPPFGEAPYPARFDLAYPDHLSRLLIFVKWILVLPHIVALWFIYLAASVVWLLGFFAILITSNLPRGMFDFLVGTLRWTFRINAYIYLMTDRYPPFRMSE